MSANKLVLALLGLAGILIVWSVASAHPVIEPHDGATVAAGKKATMRVGTFARSVLLEAYYCSAHFELVMIKRRAEQAQAQKDGDEAKAKEVEERIAALQETAHKQLTGEAPITNVLECLADALPVIARETGVQVIVEKPLFCDGSVELVDITKQMVKALGPTSKG